ncbi:response regulator [Macrococcoides caseolyticum]|uniref:response regulator transcription factor n=1 Tax=Macrococcoides caseolyticum TaxID=69966 RepID=UPI0018E2BA7E|nr:response regulator transcription factor [Macrococcus caseolyticus]
MTKLIILTDHELFALGIKYILSVENKISVVDILTEHESLGESIRKHNPDVILTDIRLKKVNGLKLIKFYKNIHPYIKFIVISGYNMSIYKKIAIESGASAFLLKDSTSSILIQTIKDVINDKDVVFQEDSFILSKEELEVLSHISNDLTNKDISEKTFMSKRKVEYLVSNIIQKLNVNSRLGAVLKAVNLGLIDSNDIQISKNRQTKIEIFYFGLLFFWNRYTI